MVDTTKPGNALMSLPACEWNSELVAPGLKPDTKIPLFLNSCQSDSEKLAIKLLVAAYTAPPGNEECASSDPILISALPDTAFRKNA